MADVFLICEGHADGVDVRVLDKIIAQVIAPGAGIQVVPTGGDKSLRGVRHYHEDRSRRVEKDGKLGRPRDKAFSIEDRNFRSRADADASWRSPINKSLMWRRHEIENYLLAPRIVLSAFNSWRPSEPWAASLPSDEKGVLAFLMDLARPLLEGHAGELLRCELDVAVKQGRAFSLSNPGKSTRGWKRTDWLAHLHQEGQRIQSECNTVTGLPDLAPAAMDQHYDAIYTRVSAPQFLTSAEFIEEMGGHELMSALVEHLHSLGGTKLATEDLENELVDAIGREYSAGLFVPDDFAELAKRIR